jgi:hypothetical protein
MARELSLGALIIAVVIAAIACDRGSSTSSRSSGNTEAATRAAPSAKVAKIVFVDKQNACECTRARIDKTWNALQKVLGSPASIPIERYDLDTQAEQLEPYFLMERLMVPPGIYLLDEGNGVIQLLQGELTEQQLREALAGSAGR